MHHRPSQLAALAALTALSACSKEATSDIDTFELPACTSYGATSNLPLEDLIVAVKDSPQQLSSLPFSQADLFLRIAEECARVSNDDSFTVDKADETKKQIWDMANRIVNSLSIEERTRGRELSQVERVRVALSIFFNEEDGFDWPDSQDMTDLENIDWERYRRSNEAAPRRFDTVWETRRGVCEDLTGALLSVVDVLRRGGVQLDLYPVLIPGHIFVGVPHNSVSIDSGTRGATYFELTERGEEIPLEDYVTRSRLEVSDEHPYLQMNPIVGVSAELSNQSNEAVVEGHFSLGRKLFGLANQLCPRGYAPYVVEAQILARKSEETQDPDEKQRLMNQSIDLHQEGLLRQPGTLSEYLVCIISLEEMSADSSNDADKIRYLDRARTFLQMASQAIDLGDEKQADSFRRSFRARQASLLEQRFDIGEDLSDLKHAALLLQANEEGLTGVERSRARSKTLLCELRAFFASSGYQADSDTFQTRDLQKIISDIGEVIAETDPEHLSNPSAQNGDIETRIAANNLQKDLLAMRAHCYRLLGEHEKARIDFSEMSLLSDFPDTTFPNLESTIRCYQEGRIDDARRALNFVIPGLGEMEREEITDVLTGKQAVQHMILLGNPGFQLAMREILADPKLTKFILDACRE